MEQNQRPETGQTDKQGCMAKFGRQIGRRVLRMRTAPEKVEEFLSTEAQKREQAEQVISDLEERVIAVDKSEEIADAMRRHPSSFSRQRHQQG